jgi:hypothetical protein
LRLFSFERKQGAKVQLRIADCGPWFRMIADLLGCLTADVKQRLKTASICNPQATIRNGAAPGIVIALETSHCIHIARGLISAAEAL